MSSYFKSFPKVNYFLQESEKPVQITNILKRFAFSQESRENNNVILKYKIQMGDRPDVIAEKYYGSSDYDWIVLQFNYMINPLFEWPLFGSDFENYISKKYGSLYEAQSTPKKYYKFLRKRTTTNSGKVIPAKIVEVDSVTYFNTEPSFRRLQSAYDWEVEQNEIRTNISLLDSNYLNQILRESKTILKDGVV